MGSGHIIDELGNVMLLHAQHANPRTGQVDVLGSKQDMPAGFHREAD